MTKKMKWKIESYEKSYTIRIIPKSNEKQKKIRLYGKSKVKSYKKKLQKNMQQYGKLE